MMPSQPPTETTEELRDRLSRSLWKSLRTLNLKEPPKFLVRMDQGLVDRAFKALCDRLDGPDFEGWDEFNRRCDEEGPKTIVEEFADAIRTAEDEIEAEEHYPDLEADMERDRDRRKAKLLTVLITTVEALSDFGMNYDDLANCVAMTLHAARSGEINRFLEHCRSFRATEEAE